ncbi:hypothetical protein CLU79DRAFT_731073 [Phycomyces nitens]|nr:hypothetical protein CLU79DRAFT_731073 [Phycomyces nitens]
MNSINHDHRQSPYWTHHIHDPCTNPQPPLRSRQNSPLVESPANYYHSRQSPRIYCLDRDHQRLLSRQSPPSNSSPRERHGLGRQRRSNATNTTNTTNTTNQDIPVTDHTHSHYRHSSPHQSTLAIPVRQRSIGSSGHSSTNSSPTGPNSVSNSHKANKAAYITRKPLPTSSPSRQPSISRYSPRHTTPDWRIADQKGQYDHLFLRSPLSDTSTQPKQQPSCRYSSEPLPNTPYCSKSTPLYAHQQVDNISHGLRTTFISPQPRREKSILAKQEKVQRSSLAPKQVACQNRPHLRRSVSSDAQIQTTTTTTTKNNSSSSSSSSEEDSVDNPKLSLDSVRPPSFWNPRQEGQGLSTQKLSYQWRMLWKPRRTLLEQTSEDQFTADRLQSLERTRTPSVQQDFGAIDPFLLLYNTLEVADTRELEFLDTEFVQIDAYAANVHQRGQMVTPQLLSQKFLTRPYRRELHKVRSIFVWLVQNIAIQETETLIDETAEQVLMDRSCSSSLGLATLFCEMARAAGINDTHVICGYWRAPKDTLEDACKQGYLAPNHAWCSIKVEGEYRMVDCWLASPNHILNEAIEPHWFLTTPLSMIHTHLPSDDRHQYLDPPLHPSSFFSLPQVWIPFFSHHIQVIDFDPSVLTLVDNQTYHLTINVDPDTACYVQVECPDGTLVRGLAQLEPFSDRRTYRIKAVLPLDARTGWLQVYCGPRSTLENSAPSYSLAMSLLLTHTGKSRAFEFVKLHVNHEQFFIEEPQCYQIYPRQPYSFRIIKDDSRHPKMAIKSPTGKIFKLLYTPQDHSYATNITVTEIGQWTLVCLYHHAERWQTIANWECRI